MNTSNGSTTLFANGGHFGKFINPQYALDINGVTRANNNITTPQGAVGIGLSNPLCQLHIQAPNAINANSNNIFMECYNVVGYPTISFNGYYQGGFHYMNNTKSIFRIGNEQRVSNDDIFRDITEPSGAGFCLWYGNSNGLGINNTNPQYNLDVTGTTNIAGNCSVSSTFGNSGNAYFQNATINGTLTLNSALNTPNFINLTKMNNNSNAITINLNWTSNVTNPSYFSIIETTQTTSANNSNGSRRCRYAISMSNSGIGISAIEMADTFGNNTNAYTSLLISSVGTTTNSISIQSATNWITSSTPCTHIFTLQTISYPFGNVGVISLT